MTQAPPQPLTDDDLRALADANLAYRRQATRLAGLAAFTGWSTIVLAVLALPFGFVYPTAFIVGGALLGVGLRELQGRRKLLRLEPNAYSHLASNQWLLAGVIGAYCLWRIYLGLTGPNPLTEPNDDLPAEYTQLFEDLKEFEWLYPIVLGVYGTVLVVTLIYQAIMAAFYLSRRKHLAAYLAETPEWILDTQRKSP